VSFALLTTHIWVPSNAIPPGPGPTVKVAIVDPEGDPDVLAVGGDHVRPEHHGEGAERSARRGAAGGDGLLADARREEARGARGARQSSAWATAGVRPRRAARMVLRT
jgi:hypothetical protein